MTKKHKIDWDADVSLPAGKGATVQRFTAKDGEDRLEIDTTPWGDGDLKINEKTVARVVDDKGGAEAFRDLEALAESIEERNGSSE
ncbi:MAG: hypothetical protein LCH61_01305 [Proteobacteria bacterium]|nr:hypothetical protein [Pseudomonadota bacterium]MCA0421954.1 hypothetical protein [Pseudomonadota bacterium]